MALFRRNKQDDAPALSPELDSYYKAEHNDRSWMAWLLGLATLVVTVLLALALFFGGRWAFRKIRNEPTKVTTVQTDNGLKDLSKNDTSEDIKSSNNQATSSSDATSVAPGTNQTNSTASNTAPKPTTTNTSLPNTGPSDTIAIFVAISLLAYFLHRKFATNN